MSNKAIAAISEPDLDFVAVVDQCSYSSVVMWDRYLVRKGYKATAETTDSLHSKYPDVKPWDVAKWLPKVIGTAQATVSDFVMGDANRLTSVIYDNLVADKNDRRLNHPTNPSLKVKQPSVVATRGSDPARWNLDPIDHMVLVSGAQIDSAGKPLYVEGLNPVPSRPRTLRGRSGSKVNFFLDGVDWLNWIQLGSTVYVPVNPVAAPVRLSSVSPTTAFAGLWMPPAGAFAKPTQLALSGVTISDLEATTDLCGGI